jgi:hypothetical protein
MEKPKNKTRNMFVGTVIVAVLVLLLGWMYLRSQQTAIELSSDQPAYFTVDNPIVTVKALNTKNADAGEIRLSYDDEMLTLTESETSDGVTMRELDNSVIFELSSEYFSAADTVVAKLTFESNGIGETSVTLDQDGSSLSAGSEEIEVTKYEDVSFEVGIAPDRGEQKVTKGEF